MKRIANDAGVVIEATQPVQPPLICPLDASQICPCLSAEGFIILDL